MEFIKTFVEVDIEGLYDIVFYVYEQRRRVKVVVTDKEDAVVLSTNLTIPEMESLRNTLSEILEHLEFS